MLSHEGKGQYVKGEPRSKQKSKRPAVFVRLALLRPKDVFVSTLTEFTFTCINQGTSLNDGPLITISLSMSREKRTIYRPFYMLNSKSWIEQCLQP